MGSPRDGFLQSRIWLSVGFHKFSPLPTSFSVITPSHAPLDLRWCSRLCKTLSLHRSRSFSSEAVIALKYFGDHKERWCDPLLCLSGGVSSGPKEHQTLQWKEAAHWQPPCEAPTFVLPRLRTCLVSRTEPEQEGTMPMAHRLSGLSAPPAHCSSFPLASSSPFLKKSCLWFKKNSRCLGGSGS